MGDFYKFENRFIDGKLVEGFCFSNAATNFTKIFVQFDDNQAKKAREMKAKFEPLEDERDELIKSWIN